jgi:hypothetical protein
MQPFLTATLISFFEFPEDGISKFLKASVTDNQSTRCHILKEYSLYQQRSEYFNSHSCRVISLQLATSTIFVRVHVGVSI